MIRVYTGRLHVTPEATVAGEITYNGDTLNSGAFDATSVVSFAEQMDTHEPYLTVRETLLFAGICNLPIVTSKVCRFAPRLLWTSCK